MREQSGVSEYTACIIPEPMDETFSMVHTVPWRKFRPQKCEFLTLVFPHTYSAKKNHPERAAHALSHLATLPMRQCSQQPLCRPRA
jgi:hypothetical protein